MTIRLRATALDVGLVAVRLSISAFDVSLVAIRFRLGPLDVGLMAVWFGLGSALDVGLVAVRLCLFGGAAYSGQSCSLTGTIVTTYARQVRQEPAPGGGQSRQKRAL